MKTILITALIFFSLSATAQQSYMSVFGSYGERKNIQLFNTYKTKTFLGSIGFEKYFKNGIKLSAGLSYLSYLFPTHIYEFADTTGKTYHYSNRYHSQMLEIPLFFAYNVLPKKTYPLQLFLYAGYVYNVELKSILTAKDLDANKTYIEKRIGNNTSSLFSGIEVSCILFKYFKPSLSIDFSKMAPHFSHGFTQQTITFKFAYLPSRK